MVRNGSKYLKLAQNASEWLRKPQKGSARLRMTQNGALGSDWLSLDELRLLQIGYRLAPDSD